MTQQEWLKVFCAEYERRTGISWEADGNTKEDALHRYFPKWESDPIEAVLHNLWTKRYYMIDD